MGYPLSFIGVDMMKHDSIDARHVGDIGAGNSAAGGGANEAGRSERDAQRPTVDSRAKFEAVFEGQFCAIGVRRGYYGLREVRFVMKPHQKEEKTIHETLELAAREVNVALKKVPGAPAGSTFRVFLLGNSAPKHPLMRELAVKFTPVVMGSGSRTGDAHAAFLEGFGLLPVPSALVKIAAGAFRVARGFPSAEGDIGTLRDQGDLLEGYCIRTALASRGCSAQTTRSGVKGSFAWHVAHEDILVAGGAPSDDLRLLLQR